MNTTDHNMEHGNWDSILFLIITQNVSPQTLSTSIPLEGLKLGGKREEENNTCQSTDLAILSMYGLISVISGHWGSRSQAAEVNGDETTPAETERHLSCFALKT